MPFSLTWESPETVRVAFFGSVTFADTVKATEGLYTDARSDRIKFAFWDFSTISDFSVSPSEVDEMAAMDSAASEYMRPMKAAFIIRDAGLWELGEQYIASLSQMGSPWQNKLFSTMEDARLWAHGEAADR